VSGTRTVNGNDLARMLLETLRHHVAHLPEPMRATVATQRQLARNLLDQAKRHDNAAPLLGMLIESLTVLAEDDPQGAPSVH